MRLLTAENLSHHIARKNILKLESSESISSECHSSDSSQEEQDDWSETVEVLFDIFESK